MMLIASSLRPAGERSAEALVRLAGDAGFGGIALGPSCARTDAIELVAGAAAAGLAVPVAATPFLETAALPPGKRLPFFAAFDDPEERRAAVALFGRTLAAAVPLGVRVFTLYLGDVPLGVSALEIKRRFQRRELDEDEPGAAPLADAFAERRARSPQILDACRFSLDLLAPLAERASVTVALEVSGGPWGAPTPREATVLLEEYREAPFGVVWDDARLHVLRTLGAAPIEERARMLAAAARVRRANEAVGIDVGFLPGQGDSPLPALADIAPAPGTPTVVAGRGDSTVEELRRARTLAAPAEPKQPASAESAR